MRFILVLLLLVGLSSTAFAASRDFVWEASPTPNITSYTFYYGGPTGGAITGLPTSADSNGDVFYTLDTTGMNGNYEFNVTASNQDGESAPSNTVTDFLGVPVMGQTLRLR